MWESSEPEQNEDTSKEAEDGKEKSWGGTLEVRLLIAEEEAPVLIGKAGSNSKLLREKHSVHLTLGKTSNASERICTIKGTVENLTECITHIAELFVTNSHQIHKVRGGVPPGGSADACTIALLVHDTLAGLVIGRRGAVAKTIFTEIKGKVKVSDTCIPHTTDKVAYLTGTPEQLRQMLLLVLKYLVDKFPKADSPIRNYFPEPRSSYRYDENQWPKPARKWGPPIRDPRDYSPQRYDDRARSRDRYDDWGPPPGDRYSERPAYRPPFDDRYPPRDPYDRYADGPSPRDAYYPTRPARGAPYGYPPDEVAADYPLSRAPDYPPSRALDYPPSRASDFPPSRTSEYPSRAEYPPARASEYPRVAEYPPSRAAEYPPSRADEYPPSRAAEYPPSRAAEYPPSRAAEYPPSRAAEHPRPRASEYPPSRGVEYSSAPTAPRGKAEYGGASANGYENYPTRGPVGGLANGGSSYGGERPGVPFASAPLADGERRAPLKAPFNASAPTANRPAGVEPRSSYGAARPVW